MSGTFSTAGSFLPTMSPTQFYSSHTCRDTGKYCDQIKEFQTEPATRSTQRPELTPTKPKDVIVGKPYNRQPPSEPAHISATFTSHPSRQKDHVSQMPGGRYPTSVPLFKNPPTSSFSSTMQAPSTPYPYYQRKPKNDLGYNKYSTPFQRPSQSFTESPFNVPFDPIMIKKPSSFFPKETSFPDFPSSEQHDEHIKNFPLEDFHTQNGLLNKFHKEDDEVMTGVDFNLTPDPTLSPKRKKKLRGSRPSRNKSKKPNIFESYFNALRDGLNLPTLRGGKKEKTRQSSAGGLRKRRKRKKQNTASWNEDEIFMADFMGNADDIFR